MAKYECLGCGKVIEAAQKPKKCDKCGDNVADNGGAPVFKRQFF